MTEHKGLYTCPACKETSWKWIKIDYLHIEGKDTVCCPNCGVIIAVPNRKTA